MSLHMSVPRHRVILCHVMSKRDDDPCQCGSKVLIELNLVLTSASCAVSFSGIHDSTATAVQSDMI